MTLRDQHGVTVAELEGKPCTNPECSGECEAPFVRLAPICHPQASVVAIYVREHACVDVICARCGDACISFAVAFQRQQTETATIQNPQTN